MRAFGVGLGVFGLLAAAFVFQTTVVTQSADGDNYAEIIQSGPGESQKVVVTKRGPGVTVIEKHGGQNSAVVIQWNHPE